MTMHINLSTEMEAYIKAKVGSGFYGNATEVIRDAVRRMQAEDARVKALHSAIAVGQSELDRGEGIAYTPELMSQIYDEAMATSGSDALTQPQALG